MIELVSDARCVGCDICVKVCPTNVFEAVPGQAPVIARQEDCQTCFMCELYCPTDALFVAPDADGNVQVDEAQLAREGALGSYRSAVGWGKGQKPGAQNDLSFRLLYMAPAAMGAALPGAEPAPPAAQASTTPAR